MFSKYLSHSALTRANHRSYFSLAALLLAMAIRIENMYFLRSYSSSDTSSRLGGVLPDSVDGLGSGVRINHLSARFVKMETLLLIFSKGYAITNTAIEQFKVIKPIDDFANKPFIFLIHYRNRR